MKLPVLFISHGSPEFALLPGLLGPELTRLGEQWPRPRAIVALSPHWMSYGRQVQATALPQTIYDFGGFSPALYQLRYEAPGAPQLAAVIRQLLAEHHLEADLNDSAGRDHGVWVPLRHLYPQADVPVLQISMRPDDDPHSMFELGQVLAPLRQQNVLLLGSGGLTHNLRDFRHAAAGEYVQPFADWMAERLAGGDVEALLAYRTRAPGALRAHPTEEHLLPLFFALGAAEEKERKACRIEGGITDSVLCMDSFIFGDVTTGSQAVEGKNMRMSAG